MKPRAFFLQSSSSMPYVYIILIIVEPIIYFFRTGMNMSIPIYEFNGIS